MVAAFILCLVTVAFCLLGRRMSSTILTAPMLFLGLGVVLHYSSFVPSFDMEVMLDPVAELALVVLLFLDAAQTDLKALQKRHVWPVRMLLIGLPLAVLLGTLAGSVLFPEWPLVAVALVAAILAPTDAALGQAVVTNPAVPERPRRALTVESGLNDGMALPLVLMLASLSAATTETDGGQWLIFGAQQVILGPLAGVVIGVAGGWAMVHANARGLTSDPYKGIAALCTAGGAYVLALLIGGNGFIAAFVAGLAFGAWTKGVCDFVYEFAESEGQLLAWAAFLLIGGVLVPEAIAHLTWPMFGLILLSLFVLRPLAIWVSLIGSDASPLTRLFFGWFGPRGLATALFALMVFEDVPDAYSDTVLYVAVNAIWISALLHGITAAPGARWYGRMVDQMGLSAEARLIRTSAIPLVTRPAMPEDGDEGANPEAPGA